MKVKKLYNLIKESLAEVLKEQDVIDAPVSDFLGVNPDSSNWLYSIRPCSLIAVNTWKYWASVSFGV